MYTPRDNNRIAAKMGVLYTDGVTLVPISIDTNGNMMVEQVATLSASIPTVALHDENFETVLMGVSSVDNITPIPIFVTATGKVLIDT